MRRSWPGVALAVVLIGTACSAASSTAPRPARPGSTATATSLRSVTIPSAVTTPDATKPMIQLGEHFYTPAQLTIGVGSTVTWRNVGQQTHDVNAYDGSFRSGSLGTGQTFSYTFTKPGRFRYYCSPHEGDGMIGEVVVE